ncbi:conjugal transfer protein TrbC, partial [Escherichia coli]|nr:conjugal transfer protein TrbC [Escherichia coli]
MAIDSRPVDKQRVQHVIKSTWLMDILQSPFSLQAGMLGGLLLCLIAPWLLLPTLFCAVIWLFVFTDQRFRLPLRMPTDIGGFDYSTEREEANEFTLPGGFFRFIRRKLTIEKAGGIMCLGYARKRFLGRELWLTRDDCLRHMQLLATTGSGKTEALLSLQLNAICLGRGYCYSDGKAETALAFSSWSLLRRFGLEDNFYVLNFLNGGRDRFDELLSNDRTRPQSNTINLSNNATASYIIQLMESMLPKVDGSSADWQDKA